MLAPRDESEDPGPGPIPVMDDLSIAQAEHDVSLGDEFEVAAPIRFERGAAAVERAPIDLDDEPIPDEHVDPANAHDGDLNAVRDPA